MADELVVQENTGLVIQTTVEGMLERRAAVKELMENVMKEGVDYGKIPGCGDKPTLLKPGCEKLCSTFGLAPRISVKQRYLENSHIEFFITCSMYSFSGVFLGEGVGMTSTMESKWRYRNSDILCPVCNNPTIRKDKNPPYGYYCWDKLGGCKRKFQPTDQSITGQVQGKVENENIADIYNTALKIAKKRAQTDAVITVTGVSDLFTQDVEDLPDAGYKPKKVMPKPETEPTPEASEAVDAEIIPTPEPPPLDIPEEAPPINRENIQYRGFINGCRNDIEAELGEKFNPGGHFENAVWKWYESLNTPFTLGFIQYLNDNRQHFIETFCAFRLEKATDKTKQENENGV